MKPKNTRQALLTEGFDRIHEKGYNATGIQEITDAVKVSKGSFYNHFRKKEKFVIELIDDFGKLLAKEHKEVLLHSEEKPLQRLEKFYEQKIQDIIHKSHFLKGCFVSNMCQEVADNSELVAESVDQAFEGMRIVIAKCLEEAQKEGDISADTDVEVLAEFLLNSWNGALMRVKASRNAKALDAFMVFFKSLSK